MPIICLILFLFPMALKAQDGFVPGKPKLAYWKIGSKEEVTIVIHGGPGVTHDYLRPEWDRLAQSATVVYYDQRGNGKSEKAACYSWRAHVHDFSMLIASVSPNRPVILAGSSWGVVLAILFAHTHPELVKGIILTGTVSWQGGGSEIQDCNSYTYKAPTAEELAMLNQALEKFKQEIDTSQFKDQPPLFTPKEEEAIKNKNIQVSDKVQHETLSSLQDAPSYAELNTDVPMIIFQGTKKCLYSDVSKIYADLSTTF